jgi:GTP-binding protein
MSGWSDCPNAGKSTFINAVTYGPGQGRRLRLSKPFVPNSAWSATAAREFVAADIPGLIEGAAEARASVTASSAISSAARRCLHLVDANDEDVATSYRVVRDELDAYGAGLADKPVVVALNKIDTLG